MFVLALSQPNQASVRLERRLQSSYPYVKIFAKVPLMNWRRNGLSSALMPGVNGHPELREGAIWAVLGGMPNAGGNGIHIFVMAAFSWMATSEVIGMALLEHSSALLAKQIPEYYTILREMAIRIAHCHSTKLRAALPECLAKNRAVFEGSKAGLKAVMKVMMTDTEPHVRVAFLKNYLAYDMKNYI